MDQRLRKFHIIERISAAPNKVLISDGLLPKKGVLSAETIDAMLAKTDNGWVVRENVLGGNGDTTEDTTEDTTAQQLPLFAFTD